MNGRTALVTGANSGLGLETASALAGMGARTIVTTRDGAKGETTVATIRSRYPDADVVAMELELSRLASVRAFTSEFLDRFDALHVLINNAGVMHTHRGATEDGFEETFQVNHLSPFLLTNLLLDRLKASAPSRVINVSSMTHRTAAFDFDDLHSERGFRGMRVYGQSKLAITSFTLELARRLEGTGVTVNAFDPGGARTNVTRRRRVIGPLMRVAFVVLPSAASAAKSLARLASDPDLEYRTGEYWFRANTMPPSGAARDEEAARRLWDVSAELVGLS